MKNDFQKLIVLLCFILTSSQSISQESKNFKITSELTKIALANNRVPSLKIYPVNNKEIEYYASKGSILSDTLSKKLAYVIDRTPINLDSLSGTFIELPEKYMLSISDVEGKFMKNELVSESTSYRNNKQLTEPYPVIKNIDNGKHYFVLSDYFLTALENERAKTRYSNMGTSIEYKNWKAKYLNAIQSAQQNVNTCNSIIAKHSYKNRLGEKLYDASAFTKEEKLRFNKSLDALAAMNIKIKGLENDYQEYYLYYADKATDAESTKTYNLSSFYNSTSYAN